MGKRTTTKRLSPMSQSASQLIDIKARKRIEKLYELTDEIINAYNEINEKYVYQIYRKYKQLQEVNKKLKDKLSHHHCVGCKCKKQSNEDNDDDNDNNDDENDNDTHKENKNSTPSPTTKTNSIRLRNKKINPFIISDIDDTQIFDTNESQLNKNTSDDTEDSGNKTTMDTSDNIDQIRSNNTESEQENDENSEANEHNDEDNGMTSLPLALQNVIKNKATRNKNAKTYLLEIPRYPALCEYLRDKSQTSFDHRPSEKQVRPLIENHLGQNLVKDSKVRMRLRDELREIHRSYMRTFMNDPHAAGPKSSITKNKHLNVKKSPM